MASDETATTSLPQSVLDFFDGKLRIGYLATSRPDGNLAVVPVGVMIHEGRIKISCPTKTFKVRNLRSDPRTSICVTDPQNVQRYLTIRGTAELADDTGREFVNWLARTHMGSDKYPYESSKVARTVITLRPEHFSMPKVHGAS